MSHRVPEQVNQEYNMPKDKHKSNWVSRMARKVKRHFRAEQRMKKETAKKKRYAKHYAKAGKYAMTYAQWEKKGEQPTYFKGAGGRRGTTEAQLREAGISPRRK